MFIPQTLEPNEVSFVRLVKTKSPPPANNMVEELA